MSLYAQRLTTALSVHTQLINGDQIFEMQTGSSISVAM